MRTSPFDERQLALRHRIATSSLVLLAVLVAGNAIIDETWGLWGTATQQAFALLALTGCHFAVRAIWGHAYEGQTARTRALWVLNSLVIVTSAAMLIADGFTGRYAVWSHGRAGQYFELTIVLGYFLIVAAAAWARRRADATVQA